MKNAKSFKLVLVTAPNLKTARMLARTALKAKLIACANIVPKIESHYWWQDNIESSAEALIVMKTTIKKMERLEKLILSAHPYDTPEILLLPIQAGSPKYLSWLLDSVQAAGK